MDKKAIFDFDKTLVSINSFTYWIFHLWLMSLKDFNFRLFIKISYLIFVRKIIKKISHNDFKKELLLLNYKKQYDISYCKKLYKYINKNIINDLKELKRLNYNLAISSAAPEKYLKIFVENFLKMNEILVIGSTIEKNILLDNFGKNKLSNLVKNKFIDENEAYEYLFTDSDDDISLAKNAKKVYLISPTKKSIRSYAAIYFSKIEIKKAEF